MGSTASLCQVGSVNDSDLQSSRNGKVQVSMYRENANYPSNRGVQRGRPTARGWNVDQCNGYYNPGPKVIYNPNSYGNLAKEQSGRRGSVVAQTTRRRSNVPSNDRYVPEAYWERDVPRVNVAPAQDRMREVGRSEMLQKRLNEVLHDLEHCLSNDETSAILGKLDILQRKIIEITPNEVESSHEEQIKLQAMKLKKLEQKVEELVAIAKGQFDSSYGEVMEQHGELIKRGVMNATQPNSQGVAVLSNVGNLTQNPRREYLQTPTGLNSWIQPSRSDNIPVNETSTAKQFSSVNNQTARCFRPVDKRMDPTVQYWSGANTQTGHVTSAQEYKGRSHPYGPTHGGRPLPVRYSSERAFQESHAVQHPRQMDRRPRPREEYRKPNPAPVRKVSTFRKYIKNPFKWKHTENTNPPPRQETFEGNYLRVPQTANNEPIGYRRQNYFARSPMYATQVRKPAQNLATRRTSLHSGWDR